MFNVGGGEFLVIFLVALIVLGPTKLPEVARQVGGMMRELRRISSGFQDEMRAAMDDPVETAARDRGNRVVATSESPAPAGDLGDELDDDDADDDDAEVPGDTHPTGDDTDGGGAETDAGAAPMSTAAAAGMYDIAPAQPTSTPNPYRAAVGTRAQPVDAGDATAIGAVTDDPEDLSAGDDAAVDRADVPVGDADDHEAGAGTGDVALATDGAAGSGAVDTADVETADLETADVETADVETADDGSRQGTTGER